MIKKAVENSLLFDEHTFGLAMSHGHSGYWCYGDQFKDLRTENVFDPIEFSWKEKSLRVIDAERIIVPALNDKIRELANSVAVKDAHITVYNPLPWRRNGVVVLQMLSANLKNASALKDLATGEMIDLSNKGNVIRFVARDVPAMGYKTYIPVENKITEKSGLRLAKDKDIIENELLKVVIDRARGGLASVTDKITGCEMVSPGSQYVFGGYVYERFSRENTESYAKDYIKGGWEWAPAELGRPNLTDEKYRQVHPLPYNVEYEIDNVKVSAILHFKRDDDNPHDYTLIFSLYEDLPFLEEQWGISGKSPDPWPEAGWISFPFSVDKPSFRLGRLGAIVDPSQDFIKNSNLDYCFVNSGIAVTGSDMKGFGISSPDVPGISLDRPGLWKFSRNFTPSQANIFYNLYNNQWSTNFTEWIEGSWSAKFYIWPVENFDNEKSIITPSEEFRVPLIADYSPGNNGMIPVSARGIELSMKGVLVTAFGRNPYGNGLILRLWEQAGKNGKCIISLPEGLEGKTVIPVNLRGEVMGSPFEIRDNSISVDISAYKPYSFMIL
jgi:alpha-mannosidase